MGDKVFLHAEIAALSRLKSFHKPYKIVVERYKEDGTQAMAKPCPICMEAIKAHGIQRIEFTC